MAIRLRGCSRKIQFYKVRGDNLATIWEGILRSGPRDGGRRYAGECVCHAHVIERSLNFATDWRGADGGIETTNHIEDGYLEWKCIILLPKAVDARRLSRNARREWDRFMDCLKVHELSHIPPFQEELERIIQEVCQVTADGRGPNLQQASRQANNQIVQTVNHRFGGRVMRNRLNNIAAAHDQSTGHGRTQRAVLDTSIN